MMIRGLASVILMVLAIVVVVEGPLLWESTNTTHDDLPPSAPCHASEAEFHSLQCPPLTNTTGLG
jgi:hypothetical protein